jgi:hypothetical protein
MFCPHCIYVFCICLTKTATCATYSTNWLVFITKMKSVYSAVRTGSLNKAVCDSAAKGYFTGKRVILISLIRSSRVPHPCQGYVFYFVPYRSIFLCSVWMPASVHCRDLKFFMFRRPRCTKFSECIWLYGTIENFQFWSWNLKPSFLEGLNME